ncbi:MAG: 50S ribosomal protein L24e [Candidatus Diapherotrites archaeon]
MKCSFCGNEMPKGMGKIVARKDNTVVFLCTKKCEKNLLKLNRAPNRTRWTEAYKKTKVARLATAAKKEGSA